jgi:hypothetical protein
MVRSVTFNNKGVIVASDAERLAQYCPDLRNWPESWSGDPCDIQRGQRLLACFTPFLIHLPDLGLAHKTLRLHRDNLWLLGGELVRAMYDDPPSRNRPMEQSLEYAIGTDGGPLIYNGTEEQQRSFDSTCRRFHRFLQINQSPSD